MDKEVRCGECNNAGFWVRSFGSTLFVNCRECGAIVALIADDGFSLVGDIAERERGQGDKGGAIGQAV